jgi:hypothetical protein
VRQRQLDGIQDLLFSLSQSPNILPANIWDLGIGGMGNKTRGVGYK